MRHFIIHAPITSTPEMKPPHQDTSTSPKGDESGQISMSLGQLPALYHIKWDITRESTLGKNQEGSML